MLLRRLTVDEFRCYQHAELELSPGLTVVRGRNGQGKTNLVEAIAYLSRAASFRDVPTDVLIRDGAERGRVSGSVDVEGRSVDIEAHLARRGPNRIVVNGQRTSRKTDLLEVLRVTVFTPDDLELIKSGPSVRRHYLDELLVTLRPAMDAVRTDLERVLRQRATLLKQAGPRPGQELLATLDVWDERLADLGTRLGEARRELVADLAGWVSDAYHRLASSDEPVALTYEASWLDSGLATAIAAARCEDLRRGTTSAGPHRDELRIELRHTAARTHASQGEQRCLALALRLGGHELVRDRYRTSPVLLLDDVFSELDPHRTEALLQHLPPGQTVLTTAEAIPPQARADLVVTVDAGVVR